MLNTLPALAQQAYTRYVEKYQTDLDLLDRMTDLYGTAYQNAAAANDRQRENANASAASNAARDAAGREAPEGSARQDWDTRLSRQKLEQAQRDSYWNEVFNTQSVTKNDYANEGLRLDNMQKAGLSAILRTAFAGRACGLRLDNQLTQQKNQPAYLKNLLGL